MNINNSIVDPSLADATAIRVTIGGDFRPTTEVERILQQGLYTPDWLVGEAAPVFRQSDLAIINLECVLAATGTPINKTGPCMRAHPDTLSLLTHMGVKLATMANNHIRDFGDAGVRATLACCEAGGIATLGAGNTLAEARRIHYHEARGRRLAIINAADAEFSAARYSRAGANPLDLISMLDDIVEARHNAQHVVLVLHGGLEYTNVPSPNSIRLLRFLAEQNVTAIVRHHSHFVQGCEVWKGVPILYGVGNLYYGLPDKSVAGWFEGGVAQLDIGADNRCRFTMQGFEQCLSAPRIRMYRGSEQDDFLDRLSAYSSVLSDPERLQLEWRCMLAQRKSAYYGQLALPSELALRIVRRFGLLRYAVPRQAKRLLYEELLRCEGHREALLDILEENNA